MANKPGTRRLILCGICFKADCPLSKWVDDDGTMEVVDELHMLFIECQHNEMEAARAAKLTREEKQERIDEMVSEVKDETGQSVEIENLDELLGSAVKGMERTETDRIKMDAGSFIDDILQKYSEHVERKDDNNQQQKQH